MNKNIQKATSQYRPVSMLDNWFDRHLVFEPNKTTLLGQIYGSYKDTCDYHGSLPYGRNQFSQEIRQYIKSHPSGKWVRFKRAGSIFYEGVTYTLKEPQNKQINK